MEGGSRRRRLTLFEQMTSAENRQDTLSGFTLEAILRTAKRPEQEQQPPTQNRTLLDIIRDDGSNKDKKTWKSLLRLKRPVSSLIASVQIPSSDVIVNTNNRSQLSRNGSTDPTDPPDMNSPMQLARRDSGRFAHNLLRNDHDYSADVIIPTDAPPSRSVRSEITDGNSVESNSEEDVSPVARNETRRLGAALAEESAREAAAAQEATVEEPVRMSLMEFLEETERQMGSRDAMINGQDEEYEEKELTQTKGGMLDTCCVCMVRQKGAAFIPCGHTFCRLCSREVWVHRGNCPLCNGTIMEILDIF